MLMEGDRHPEKKQEDLQSPQRRGRTIEVTDYAAELAHEKVAEALQLQRVRL
jgi:hypothetical protein